MVLSRRGRRASFRALTAFPTSCDQYAIRHGDRGIAGRHGRLVARRGTDCHHVLSTWTSAGPAPTGIRPGQLSPPILTEFSVGARVSRNRPTDPRKGAPWPRTSRPDAGFSSSVRRPCRSPPSDRHCPRPPSRRPPLRAPCCGSPRDRPSRAYLHGLAGSVVGLVHAARGRPRRHRAPSPVSSRSSSWHAPRRPPMPGTSAAPAPTTASRSSRFPSTTCGSATSAPLSSLRPAPPPAWTPTSTGGARPARATTSPLPMTLRRPRRS